MSAISPSQHSAMLTLCERLRVRQFFLIGSAATGEFDPARSDVDFLVEFLPGPSLGLDDPYFHLLGGLEAPFGRKVDLVMASAVKSPFFKASIDPTKLPLYTAA